MPYAKLPKDFPEPKTLPKRYFEDARWINENINELTEKYSDHWIAVLEKEVVITRKDLGEVERVARKRAAEVGRGQSVYSFIERLWRFYYSADVPRPS